MKKLALVALFCSAAACVTMQPCKYEEGVNDFTLSQYAMAGPISIEAGKDSFYLTMAALDGAYFAIAGVAKLNGQLVFDVDRLIFLVDGHRYVTECVPASIERKLFGYEVTTACPIDKHLVEAVASAKSVRVFADSSIGAFDGILPSRNADVLEKLSKYAPQHIQASPTTVMYQRSEPEPAPPPCCCQCAEPVAESGD